MRRRLFGCLVLATSLVAAGPQAWGNELVVGVDVGATIPTSTFQRTADPGGMIAPFIGYQFGFGRRFAFTPILQPALFTFGTAVEHDRDSDVTSILAGTAGGRFSLFDENKEVYFSIQGGYYNDMSGPINDRGEGFNFGGGFNYEFSAGTALGLFIRRDQSSMRAARNSTKDLEFLVAGLGLRHRFLAPPTAPARPVVQAAAAPPPAPPPPVEKKKIVLRGVHFDFDKAEIRADARPILDAAAATLKQEGSIAISVEGHTDAIGTEEYNERLSVRRATAVRDYLARASVDASRMTVRGFGESQPVASNDTPDGRAQNRRVELRVSE